MLIRHLEEVSGTARDVRGEGWRSRRLIVAEDRLGFSVHATVLDSGARLQFEYERHRETVYCVKGEGTVEDLTNDRVAHLSPGSLYSAGIGEPHLIQAETEMELVCIFDPALVGTEEAD
ncbi:MAG: ectoine synthase [Acidimicrobiia bacterium]